MNDAVAALLKEYQAAVKDNKPLPREKPDYFGADKSADLTDETIVGTLASNVAPDRGADSYIKWQLLSGLGTTLDPKLLPRLLLAYRGAAAPYPRPGLSIDDKKQLDAYIRPFTASDAATINGINDKLQGLVDAWDKRNAPILKYRNALYPRLPVAAESLAAGVEDGHARVAAGISCKEFWKQLKDNIRAWEGNGPTPPQAKALADELLRVINEWGGLPAGAAKARAPAGRVTAGCSLRSARPRNGEDTAGDDVAAPVLLAAGPRMPNYGGPNYNNNTPPPDVPAEVLRPGRVRHQNQAVGLGERGPGVHR